MRVVFHHGNPVALSDREDTVHLAGHSRIVNREDSLGLRANESLQKLLIQIQRVGPDVDKHWPRTAQHKGVDRGHKGEGGNDDLVARTDVEQESGHLKSVGAGRGQKNARHPELFFQQRLAFPGVRPIAGEVAL